MRLAGPMTLFPNCREQSCVGAKKAVPAILGISLLSLPLILTGNLVPGLKILGGCTAAALAISGISLAIHIFKKHKGG